MIQELNATEIIACAVDKHVRNRAHKNDMSIRIGHIQNVAKMMELEIPSLLTQCDMVAIEDCQSEFRSNICIEPAYVRINKVNEIKPIITRFLPRHEIYNKLIEKI